MRRSGYSLRVLLICSMMCALSIVLGKYLAFNIGSFIRISGENLPILFSGLAFGPLAGISVGVVADLVGCLLVGYEVNPIITVGAGVIGFLAGTVGILARRVKLPLRIALAVLICHALGSVIIKSVGLSLYYGMPFGVTALWRGLNYILVGCVECFLLWALLSNSAIIKWTRDFSRWEKQKEE